MLHNIETTLRHQTCEKHRQLFGEPTHVVFAPYRVNPLGAHVDHQGGAVIGRSIDRGTILTFAATETMTIQLAFLQADGSMPVVTIDPKDESVLVKDWTGYANAAIRTMRDLGLQNGFTGVVAGSMIGSGVSSSASVLLAYLSAYATVNSLRLTQDKLVELVRQVENEQLGLNNGVQDQMSIVHSRCDGLAKLDTVERVALQMPDPSNVGDMCWILAYSGFTRSLLGSGFNNAVAECRHAASLLDPQASRLGGVAPSNQNWQGLPEPFNRRARHYFGETARVDAGCNHWQQGDWVGFGRLMNQSCHSSINYYESGSQPLIDLHQIASATDGVYGSRFCGGGYGGCVVALAERRHADAICQQIETQFKAKYPEKADVAKVMVVEPTNGIQIAKIMS